MTLLPDDFAHRLYREIDRHPHITMQRLMVRLDASAQSIRRYAHQLEQQGQVLSRRKRSLTLEGVETSMLTFTTTSYQEPPAKPLFVPARSPAPVKRWVDPTLVGAWRPRR